MSETAGPGLPPDGLPRAEAPGEAAPHASGPLPSQGEGQARRIPWLAWGAALVVQLGVLVAVPYPKLSAYAFGFPATLRAEVVDPYDLLRGRYVAMGYPDLRQESLEKLPGHEAVKERDGAFYVVLESRHAGYLSPVRLSAEWVRVDPSYQSLLKLRWAGGAVAFGNDRYHAEEGEAAALEAQLREHPGKGFAAFRTDSAGNAWLERVWVDPKAVVQKPSPTPSGLDAPVPSPSVDPRGVMSAPTVPTEAEPPSSDAAR